MNFRQFRALRLEILRAEPRCLNAYEDDLGNRIDGLIALIAEAKPRTVLEIGANRGISTEVFLLTCHHVTAVDPFDGGSDDDKQGTRDFMTNVVHYPNLQTIKGWSPKALASLPDESFDLCYIDGDHDVDAVAQDIAACHRLVKPDGYMAGHDYRPEATLVHKAVDAYAKGNEVKVFSDYSWLVRKQSNGRA